MGHEGNLGEFEQLVLLALLHLGQDAYGVTVRDELEHRAGRTVSLGTVYTTLGRLEEKGLVSVWVGEPTPERGGRRKKYHRVTPHGRRVLARTLATLDRMTAGLESVLERS